MGSSLTEQIEDLIRDGRADHAITLLHKKLKLTTGLDNISQLTCLLAKSYHALGLIKEAKQILTTLIEQVPSDSPSFFDAYYELGLIKLSQHEDADLPQIIETLEQNLPPENIKEKAQLEELKGLYYMRYGDTNRGKLHLNQAAQYYAQLNDHEYESYIYSRLAKFLIDEGSIIEALTYSTISMEGYPQNEKSKGLYTFILITHSRALLYNGLIKQATTTLQHASRLIYQGLPNSEPLALLLLTSIELTLQQGFIKESFIYAELAYPELQEINQPNLDILLYYNLILIYIYLMEYKLAHQLFLKTKILLQDLIPTEKYVFLLLHVFKSIYDSNTQNTPMGMLILDFIKTYFKETPLPFFAKEDAQQLFQVLANLFTKKFSPQDFQYLENICRKGFPINALFIKPFLLLILIEAYFYYYKTSQDPKVLEKIQDYLPQINELTMITGHFIFQIYQESLSRILMYLQNPRNPPATLVNGSNHQLLALKHLENQFLPPSLS